MFLLLFAIVLPRLFSIPFVLVHKKKLILFRIDLFSTVIFSLKKKEEFSYDFFL
jgi:hypothetical protein